MSSVISVLNLRARARAAAGIERVGQTPSAVVWIPSNCFFPNGVELRYRRHSRVRYLSCVGAFLVSSRIERFLKGVSGCAIAEVARRNSH